MRIYLVKHNRRFFKIIMEYWIAKNGIKTNKKQYQKPKNHPFSGTLLFK